MVDDLIKRKIDKGGMGEGVVNVRQDIFPQNQNGSLMKSIVFKHKEREIYEEWRKWGSFHDHLGWKLSKLTRRTDISLTWRPKQSPCLHFKCIERALGRSGGGLEKIKISRLGDLRTWISLFFLQASGETWPRAVKMHGSHAEMGLFLRWKGRPLLSVKWYYIWVINLTNNTLL